ILRVLEEKAFERIGGGERVRSDARVIAATNRNLPIEVAAGRFREDLFFRLNVFPIFVPPLRERKEDIPVLAAHFAGLACRELGKEERIFSREATERLLRHHWPGNVRELRNVVERLVILSVGDTIDGNAVGRVLVDESPAAEVRPPGIYDGDDFREAVLAFEREYLLRKLRENEGNISRTAEKLGIDRTSIHRKMKQFGIAPDGGRK
ncbi:MAG TPA: sigma 54-interacting transcriptional regulator, partial [Candidatus Deferrimicrobiaceae bacterium]